MDAIAFQGRQLSQHTQPRLRIKKTASRLSLRFRYLRLTSFEQVEARMLKKKMFLVDCMLEMTSTSPTDTILRRDLEGMRDMLIFHYLSVVIEKPRYRVISFICTH